MLKTGYEDYPQYDKILGIDEVGYGCGAGPIYICGSIIKKGVEFKNVKDSKKFSSEKLRKKVYDEVMANKDSVNYYVVKISVEDINQLGVSESMKMGVNTILSELDNEFDAVFMDGVDKRGINTEKPVIMIPKGDNLYQNIATASIIAKVERDEYMSKLNEEYPGYDLAKNKGYLTPNHINGLKTLGKTTIHRTKYVKNFI